MKFEHVLQIYWTKGLLINGKLQSFNSSITSLFDLTRGFNRPTKNLLMHRFEIRNKRSLLETPLTDLNPTFTSSINLIFSQLTSVNNTVLELTRYSLIRLYLIKTTRGRSHALGKPSRGQRTWSNAWTSYYNNQITRSFIGNHQRALQKNAKEEKINYKLIKKKSLRKKKKETVTTIKIKVNNWF